MGIHATRKEFMQREHISWFGQGRLGQDFLLLAISVLILAIPGYEHLFLTCF
jgi:hypothetical protein